MRICGLVLLAMAFSATAASEGSADYNSLEGGSVEIRWNIGGSPSAAEFAEYSSADIWQITACGADAPFICIELPGAPLAIPRDFAVRTRDAKTCKEPMWEFGDRHFRVVSAVRHETVTCGEGIEPHSVHLLGKSVSAYFIQITSRSASSRRHAGRLLWSPTLGLIAFSRPSGVEYWLSSACGYGAPESCRGKF